MFKGQVNYYFKVFEKNILRPETIYQNTWNLM